MSETILDSYLVKLGSTVDFQSFEKFGGQLFRSGKSVTEFSTGAAKNFESFGSAATTVLGTLSSKALRFQFEATSAFAAVAIGAAGFASHIANQDQEYRLFGERMLMDKDAARSLSWAMDDLGVSINQGLLDEETGKRLDHFYEKYQKLGGLLDSRFAINMRDIRDVSAELKYMEREGEVLAMGSLSKLWEKMGFGSGNLLRDMERLDQWIFDNIPKWSEEFSSDLLPIMQDAKQIFKDTTSVLGDMGLEFTNLVGIFSGDDSIEGAEFDFHKFAKAVGHVSHGVAEVVHFLTLLERILIRVLPLIAGITTGGSLGAITGAILGIPGGPAGILAGALAGGSIGATTGGVVGGTVTVAEEAKRFLHSQQGSSSDAGDFFGGFAGGSHAWPEDNEKRTSSRSSASGAIAEEAKKYAALVSKDTGISPDLIFAQWAHETGGFSNRGARSLNNLGGMTDPQTKDYFHYDSIGDFAKAYEKLLMNRFPGTLSAQTPEEMARALKSGNLGREYYADSERTYARGMRAHLRDYAAQPATNSSVLNVSPGAIQITPPAGASSKDIAAEIVPALDKWHKRQTRMLIGTTAAGPYAEG